MIEFDKIILKPLSRQILDFIASSDYSYSAAEIAEELKLNVRQVDAAITKTLVRYGFVIREYKLTNTLKRQYSIITCTDLGRLYYKFKMEE